MRIVVTGATGQVALPLARTLAAGGDEVWGVARFRDENARRTLEEAGVQCVTADLLEGDFSAVPGDVDAVLHFAVAHARSFDKAIAANAEATGLLMGHFRDAGSFLHCSSGAVYDPKGGPEPLREGDALGDNHRSTMPTYSISKIGAEAVARTCARLFDLPTVIARLNVPYGDNGGWPLWHLLSMEQGDAVPINEDGSSYNLIHEDDIAATIPGLLAAASVPATIVNWAGPEVVTIEEWCRELGTLTGLEPRFTPTAQTLPSVVMDTAKLQSFGPTPQVEWRDGVRRMIEARKA